MAAPAKSPFVRPLCVAGALLFYFVVRTAARGDPFSAAKLMIITGWFLLSAALAGFAQMLWKKEFGWAATFLAVLLGGIAIALLTLALQRMGLVYQ